MNIAYMLATEGLDDEQLTEWDEWLDSPFTAEEIAAEETRLRLLEEAERVLEDRSPVELDISEMPEHIRRWVEYQQQQQEARDAHTRQRLGAGPVGEPQERPGSGSGAS